MTNKYPCSCIICKAEMTTNNLGNHHKSKACRNGGKYEKLKKCPHCNICLVTFEGNIGNHVRWCENNPKLGYSKNTKREMSPEAIQIMANKISEAHKNGAYKSAPQKAINTRIKNGNLLHSEETKLKMQKSALNSGHQRKCKKSHKYIDKNNREFIFDSSWEDALAYRLDFLEIQWERPNPIKWVDKNGKIRNYFPDFYLPDHDLYIDPKNPYVELQQKEKLDIVSLQINLKILRSLQECKTYNI